MAIAPVSAMKTNLQAPACLRKRTIRLMACICKAPVIYLSRISGS